MLRILLPALLVGTPALAHEGLHHHPHGIETGWIVAAGLGVVAALALLRLWGRR
ncbi:MAG: hypothetical protein Q8K20_06495 [Gemmobacter sp.]|jgi:hypothetical protein|nr:hypothetical protein [Gemmobacter sp.]